MSQSNVMTTAGTVVWYTDKCAIATTTSAVTYQVYATALGNAPAVGNIYSNPSSVNAEGYQEIYVGVGNYLTINGDGFTAHELGTTSSAQASVFDGTPNITPPVTIDSILLTQTGDPLTTQSGAYLITN